MADMCSAEQDLTAASYRAGEQALLIVGVVSLCCLLYLLSALAESLVWNPLRKRLRRLCSCCCPAAVASWCCGGGGGGANSAAKMSTPALGSAVDEAQDVTHPKPMFLQQQQQQEPNDYVADGGGDIRLTSLPTVAAASTTVVDAAVQTKGCVRKSGTCAPPGPSWQL